MHNIPRVSLQLRHLLHSHYRKPITFNNLYSGLFQLQSRRCIHQLRQLPYNIENGLGDFLSPEGLKLIAVDYQQGLLSRLNEQVKGTDIATKSVVDTVIATAEDENFALAFNYASQALNNSFFLDCLKPRSSPAGLDEERLENYPDLWERIRVNFLDVGHFKSTFSAAAMGMTNSGWVWLVSDEQGNMEVVATFGAGTLLVRSRQHMRTSDIPILGESTDAPYMGTAMQRRIERQNLPHTVRAPNSVGIPSEGNHIFSDAPMNVSGQIAARERNKNKSSGNPYQNMGDILTPLLCVSVQEHAWVGTGYGVWGKEEYLKRFWTVVDWARVDQACKMALELGSTAGRL
ncbi:Manganese/iron superoxide dismutase [Hysterangium stoloniferum]|nr:Manganese/iron superoxide dismutase [Hysterangium stoloniferum]